MSRSPSLPERPRLDLDPEMSDAERLSAIRKHYERLLTVNEELDERLTDATETQSELQSEVDKLKRRNETLKTSSLYLASVEELTDNGEVVIKQHGNNQEVLTELSSRLDGDLEAGDRVAINDSFAIQQVLDDETDARAQAMEIDASPQVTYTDIGGIDDQVREVREAVEDPLTNPALFEEVGVEPPSGVLLHGPPGTGKTMLAKAVANETDATFIKMAGSELVRKFIGEGSRLVRDLFDLAAEREPAVIFIDEIDAVASKRTDSKTSGDAEVQRTMMQLLSEMDGFDERGEIRIIAATNRFDMLDEACLFSGNVTRIVIHYMTCHRYEYVKTIFVVRGAGHASTAMASYDAALAAANIHNYNLTSVSSVIPAEAIVEVVETAPDLGPVGNQLTVVEARMTTAETGQVAAGLGWTTGAGPGLFYEATGTDPESVRQTIDDGLSSGATLRDWSFTDRRVITETAERNPDAGEYTTVVVIAAYGESESLFRD